MLSFSYTSTGTTANCQFAVSLSDSAGDTGNGTSAMLTVNPGATTGQAVPVSLSPNPINSGNSTTVSSSIAGLNFTSPAYSWSAVGSCPGFVAPGNAPSFSYAATGTTATCQFAVSLSDSAGDAGNGTSAVLTVNAAAAPTTGQAVPVSLSSNQTIVGNSTNVSASIAGLNFTSPAYSWSAVGSCPGFSDPGSVLSFSYTSTGTTANCQFAVSLSDSAGDTGNGTSAVLTVSLAPVTANATAQSISTMENTAVSITLSGTDSNGSSLSYAIATEPSEGTLSGGAPALTYTPDTGFAGTDSFTFTVKDGNVTSAPAAVKITVSSGSGTSSPSNQIVPVDISPNPITAGQTATVSARISGLTFTSPTYSWMTTGSCPDFVAQGDVASFTYASTPSGATTSCRFSVSVIDAYGDSGLGISNALLVNAGSSAAAAPATGQSVPVILSSNPMAAGQSATVSARISGLNFSSPSYSWSALGTCPGFTDPGSVQTFSYTPTGTTSNCKLKVSMSDANGDGGTGTSASLTVKSGSGAPPSNGSGNGGLPGAGAPPSSNSSSGQQPQPLNLSAGNLTNSTAQSNETSSNSISSLIMSNLLLIFGAFSVLSLIVVVLALAAVFLYIYMKREKKPEEPQQ